MAQGTPDFAGRAVPSTPSKTISAASTNATLIKSSPGVVTGYYISNVNAAFRYVKLYNKASAPTVGTDTPAVTIGIPGFSAANINLEPALAFDVGIGLAMTASPADAASDAVALNEVIANIYFQ